MPALVERAVGGSGYCIVSHTSAREALMMLASIRADIALVDLQMPELGGLDVVRAIRQSQPQCGVILVSAHASLDRAIEAVKLGALDYLAKPLDFARLLELLEGVRDEAARRRDLLATDRATGHRLELCGMIGRSAIMQQLFALTRRVAPHARHALVTGETGAGKEGLARAIHGQGPRRGKRFVILNCAAVADESEAGLFEAADGGTLFLDEIGELAAPVQAKLLRVLETGEVQRIGAAPARVADVRIVAATSRDLRAEAEAGRFRHDLLCRLDIVELHVPALRERREDIPYLTAAFVKEFSDRFGKVIDGVSASAERMLMGGTWPGNVRELRNVVERACILAEGSMLAEREVAAAMPAAREPAPPAGVVASPSLETVERDHIIRVLNELRGNKLAAARRLGISRRTLYRRLQRHGLMTTVH